MGERTNRADAPKQEAAHRRRRPRRAASDDTVAEAKEAAVNAVEMVKEKLGQAVRTDC